jgi:hypothetical protein
MEFSEFKIDILFGRLKFNPLNAKLNPICHLLAMLGAHPILHVSRIRVKNSLTVCSGESDQANMSYGTVIYKHLYEIQVS